LVILSLVVGSRSDLVLGNRAEDARRRRASTHRNGGDRADGGAVNICRLKTKMINNVKNDNLMPLPCSRDYAKNGLARCEACPRQRGSQKRDVAHMISKHLQALPVLA
jgi:hypothetical protein